MICPLTDKVCNDPECREHGCVDESEAEGEDTKD